LEFKNPGASERSLRKEPQKGASYRLILWYTSKDSKQ
jgi:hypothetical protein